MTFFTKITCSRRTSQQLLIALLLIAQNAYGATSCLHACWAGVSQPSSHSLNQAVAATARKVIIIIIITSCPPTASSRHGSFEDCDYQITRMVQFGGQEKHHKTRSIQVKHHQSAGRQMTTASSWICHTWQSLLCNILNTFKTSSQDSSFYCYCVVLSASPSEALSIGLLILFIIVIITFLTLSTYNSEGV